MAWQRNLATTTALLEQIYNNYNKKIKIVQQAHIHIEIDLEKRDLVDMD